MSSPRIVILQRMCSVNTLMEDILRTELSCFWVNITEQSSGSTAGPLNQHQFMKTDQFKQMLSGFQLLEAEEHLSDELLHYFIKEFSVAFCSFKWSTFNLAPYSCAEICSFQSLFQTTDFLVFLGPPLQKPVCFITGIQGKSQIAVIHIHKNNSYSEDSQNIIWMVLIHLSFVKF